MKITGTYQSDGVFGRTVRIFRAEGMWETTYGEAPRIPAFTQEYALDFGAGIVGQGHFDGAMLRGNFHPKSLNHLFVNGVPLVMSSMPANFWMGTFDATRRDDGNFDVVIKRWDGRWPGNEMPKSGVFKIGGSVEPGVFEPNYEVIKDEWRKAV